MRQQCQSVGFKCPGDNVRNSTCLGKQHLGKCCPTPRPATRPQPPAPSARPGGAGSGEGAARTVLGPGCGKATGDTEERGFERPLTGHDALHAASAPSNRSSPAHRAEILLASPPPRASPAASPAETEKWGFYTGHPKASVVSLDSEHPSCRETTLQML